eukprot:3120715-Rhodomonas_salina.4
MASDRHSCLFSCLRSNLKLTWKQPNRPPCMAHTHLKRMVCDRPQLQSLARGVLVSVPPAGP